MLYADVIVDISHENLDKTYQYKVPEHLEEKAVVGALVKISFGRGSRFIQGYIVNLSTQAVYDEAKIKELSAVVEDAVVMESQLIQLAYWIKEQYGGTVNDALKVVLPVKKTVRNKEQKTVLLAVSEEKAREAYEHFKKKNNRARVRLLEALLEEIQLDYELVIKKLNISRATLKDLKELGIIKIESQIIYRNPVSQGQMEKSQIALNEEQEAIVRKVTREYADGTRRTYLIHGITGSGKTEVYMEIISHVLSEGKQVIMLIPEIALTYQTVMRFYRRFGDRISILNSRMSSGERYDQYVRAKNGDIDIIIGPRSALFVPFSNLGLIILDEEHENSYKSETVPKYHARETAIERARMAGASVILGSATPSIESYWKAEKGEYGFFSLQKRAGKGTVPKAWIVDLRKEMQEGNRSIFSRKLKECIRDRLEKRQQTMLFLNRRGYAGFVSCRSCGHVVKCPHCDVSLTSHNNGRLVCHYCGHTAEMPKNCPSCTSPYIAAFGTGTQKIEAFVKKEFPQARVLRMDNDTTAGKNGHEKILSAFANQEADILVGTQMIVKGHDFPAVTLVGILAADMSMYAGNYRAAETTFQLLSQASGRAGRGKYPGEVIIQTYNPEHYSIMTAAENDYVAFYRQEAAYRHMLLYPPAAHILAILISAEQEERVGYAAELLAHRILYLQEFVKNEIKMIGPAAASIGKIKDVYRQVIYIKAVVYADIKELKDSLEGYIREQESLKNISIHFDFDPMSSY